jgi:hypothetical protein
MEEFIKARCAVFFSHIEYLLEVAWLFKYTHVLRGKLL